MDTQPAPVPLTRSQTALSSPREAIRVKGNLVLAVQVQFEPEDGAEPEYADKRLPSGDVVLIGRGKRAQGDQKATHGNRALLSAKRKQYSFPVYEKISNNAYNDLGYFRVVEDTYEELDTASPGYKVYRFVLTPTRITNQDEASAASKWWYNEPEEQAWLETTDRAQLGVDLAAPQRNEEGQEHHGYALMTLPHRGDVVFHYHKDAKAIVGYSIATGVVWEEPIVWAAHGTVAREAGIRPHTRAGWRHGLTGPYPLKTPIKLETLRASGPKIDAVRASLALKYPGESLYFPFALSTKRPLRPTQFYMTKFPVALAALFPALHLALESAARGEARDRGAAPVNNEFGTTYVPVEVDSEAEPRDPFIVDPSVLERATAAHFTLQNCLADWLIEQKYQPLSPQADDPKFDLAWRSSEHIFVAEVKSLNDSNQEQQLRLGLGQVLRYHHLLARRFGIGNIHAVLVVERAPRDLTWRDLCSSLGVTLVWPGLFAKIGEADHDQPSES